MPPARFPPVTLYFNLRVQRPTRNYDQWIRRTADHSVPPPACAAARVGQAADTQSDRLTNAGRCGTGSCFAADCAALGDRRSSTPRTLLVLAGTGDRLGHLHEYSHGFVRFILWELKIH